MNAYALAVAGALAGIPAAAVAYSTPARGGIRLPTRWWCGAPADPVTVLLVSLAAGAVTGVVAARLPWSPAAPAYWLFAILGLSLAIIDVRRQRLPYVLTGSALIVHLLAYGAEAVSAGDVTPLVHAVSAGLATATAMLIIALVLPGQLGLGDVALTSVVATSLGALGWATVIHGIASALLVQAMAAIALRSTKRRALPMGPALIAGWLAAILLHSA